MYTGRIGLLDGARLLQAVRKDLGGLLGVGGPILEPSLSTKNNGPKFEIAIDEFLEGGHFNSIGREIFKDLRYG